MVFEQICRWILVEGKLAEMAVVALLYVEIGLWGLILGIVIIETFIVIVFLLWILYEVVVDSSASYDWGYSSFVRELLHQLSPKIACDRSGFMWAMLNYRRIVNFLCLIHLQSYVLVEVVADEVLETSV